MNNEPVRVWGAAVLAASLSLAGGCLRLDGALNLNAEGGGTLLISYSMPEERLAQLLAAKDLAGRLAAAGGMEMPADPSLLLANAFDADVVRAHLKAHLGKELALRDLRIGTHSGWRQADILLQFTRLGAVAEIPVVGEWGLMLRRGPKGVYTLAMQTPDLSGEGVLPDVSDPQIARQVQAILNGFRVTLRTEVPGDIAQSNATRCDLRRATWEFDYDKDPNCIRRLNHSILRVDFDGAGLTLPEFNKKPDEG